MCPSSWLCRRYREAFSRRVLTWVEESLFSLSFTSKFLTLLFTPESAEFLRNHQERVCRCSQPESFAGDCSSMFSVLRVDDVKGKIASLGPKVEWPGPATYHQASSHGLLMKYLRHASQPWCTHFYLACAKMHAKLGANKSTKSAYFHFCEMPKNLLFFDLEPTTVFCWHEHT
jgi:hypothetical protein